MFQLGAKATFSMPYKIALVCLIFSLSCGTVYGDTPSTGPLNEIHQSLKSAFGHDTRCADLGSDSSLCNIRTELRYRNYLSTPLTSHERFSSTPSESNQPRADLLSIFKLALEEFNLLSGMRIYWDYTERNIEQWAIKLKLKGEISISDPHYHDDDPSLQATSLANLRFSKASRRPSGLLSLLKPQKVRWNVGMNPDDLTVFGDIHINSYLSISGEFGNESNAGLYFRYPF